MAKTRPEAEVIQDKDKIQTLQAILTSELGNDLQASPRLRLQRVFMDHIGQRFDTEHSFRLLLGLPSDDLQCCGLGVSLVCLHQDDAKSQERGIRIYEKHNRST